MASFSPFQMNPNIWEAATPRKISWLGSQMVHHYQSRLIPKTFTASSKVTIAVALAGNALATVGPKPV